MAVIVSGVSESGDEYFFGVFSGGYLSEEEFISLVEDQYPHEIFEGECYIHPKQQIWDSGLIYDAPKPSTSGVKLI